MKQNIKNIHVYVCEKKNAGMDDETGNSGTLVSLLICGTDLPRIKPAYLK